MALMRPTTCGAACKRYEGESRLSFAYAPHAPYTVSEDVWQMITRRCMETNTLLHAHIHETASEVEASLALDKTHEAFHKSEHAMRLLANLERIGALKLRVCAAHMVHLDDTDIAMSHANGVSVAH